MIDNAGAIMSMKGVPALLGAKFPADCAHINRAAFSEAASSSPLYYQKQGHTIDLAFWPAPERLLDEPDELVTWARLALVAARRVAAERQRTGLRRKSKSRST